MTSDAVTPDTAERFDVFLGLFGGHRPHDIAILRAEDRRTEDRPEPNLLASSAVRSQHVMASMSFGASSSKVSATVRHPGIAGISAQYAPSSRCTIGVNLFLISFALMVDIISQNPWGLGSDSADLFRLAYVRRQRLRPSGGRARRTCRPRSSGEGRCGRDPRRFSDFGESGGFGGGKRGGQSKSATFGSYSSKIAE